MAAKETVLEESASIYQKREPKSEKQKWAEMDRRERWEYFKDYYRKKVIWGIIGVIAVCSLVYSIFGPSVEQVLYVAVINDYWGDAAQRALEDDLEMILETDPKWEEVYVDDTYFFSDNSSDAYSYVQKLAAFIFAGDVDLLVSDEPQYEVYATQDYFLDLEEVLPADLYAEVQEYLVYYTSESDGVSRPVGIRLGESSVFRSLGGYQEDPVMGILANSEYVDHAIAMIRHLFLSDADYSTAVLPEEE